jgi:F-type H+-transporting ATPase subunit b
MDLLMPDLGLFVWTSLAFLLVFFILRKKAWKPILKMLTEREAGIADAIASAEKVKKEMSQMQADNEKLLAQAREESSKMLREAKEIKDRIITESKDQAKIEAAKIVAEAQAQIENQKMAAIVAVKNEIGKLSVEVAEKLLRKQLTEKEAHQQYIQSLMADINLN